jgi:hypothetical protein
MRQTLALPLDGFARQTLQATADRHHLTEAELVAAAASYFLADRDRGRPARLLPDFARPEPAPGDSLELDLDLDDPTWEQLGEEAERQGVSVILLLAHATLYLIADLGAGRAAAHIGIAAAGRPDLEAGRT